MRTSYRSRGNSPGASRGTPAPPPERIPVLASLLLTLALVAFAAPTAQAAEEAAGEVVAITGGTVHTMAGPELESATVLLEGERIAAVGVDVEIPEGARVVDATGLHVYPGLFDSLTRLGLTEIGSVAATEDAEEIAEYNPELVTATAIHPDSEHIPVARANGVTHALSAPGGGGGGGFFGFGTSGGALAGQASVIQLSGWTAEEMALEPSAVMVLQWPDLDTTSFDFSTFSVQETPFTEAEKEYDEDVAELERWFRSAEHYARASEAGDAARFRRDVKLEALVPVVRGELPVLLVANEKRSIEDGLAFAERYGLDVILAGGAEAWKVKGMLADREVPVILRPTQSLPAEEDDPYDRPFTTAGELHAAGVTIAFATFDSSDVRLLPYEAGHAVPYGLPREEAVKAITRNPAEIFGLGDRLGTLEAGKLGNLVLTDGDPLEIRTRVERVFIRGREVSTDNKHRRLYERYRSRPGR